MLCAVPGPCLPLGLAHRKQNWWQGLPVHLLLLLLLEPVRPQLHHVPRRWSAPALHALHALLLAWGISSIVLMTCFGKGHTHLAVSWSYCGLLGFLALLWSSTCASHAVPAVLDVPVVLST